ncbi:siphovirus Gp157 family protein [Methylocaldum szegediense]|uniref:Viral Gp157 protein n=1 Tax=Methylocaldum szegediense TaxID=73780 RepID=A0ABM9HZV3_9GAMM|nr:siphovirus Gp157 family protein [Methylocaldum szegediense]CAI8796594.1 Viral Gp157 protein [Methylocaldum szegediense]
METKLYEIAAQYQEALNDLTNLDLPPDVVNDTLEALRGELSLKAWNVAAAILHMEGEAELIRQAEERMSRRRRALEMRAARLRDYLRIQMERSDMREIRSPQFVIKIKQNPPKVILDDASAIPEAFKREEIVVHIDKNGIKQALLSGQAIRGAHLEQETRLDIG